MDKADRPSDDQVIATVASMFFDEGNLDVVNLLLECNVETQWEDLDGELVFKITGPYLVIKQLLQEAKYAGEEPTPLYDSLIDNFNFVLPPPYYVRKMIVRVSPFEIVVSVISVL